MSDSSTGASAPNPSNAPNSQGAVAAISRAFNSPGAKFIMMGAITIALLIPALVVWALVEERADRARQVERQISAGWGDEQNINGPYLVIPYQITQTIKGVERTFTRDAFISAETLESDMQVEVEERKLSIYSTPLYHSKATLTGRFPVANVDAIREAGGEPDLSRAFIAFGISDPAGIRSQVLAKLGGGPEQSFLPGMREVGSRLTIRNGGNTHRGHPQVGIHLPVSEAQARSGFAFEIDMAFNGSRNLTLAPAAQNTSMAVRSNWPHPGFGGRFLPESREILEDGFSAKWTIPALARGLDAVALSDQLPHAGRAIMVSFVKPLDFYQMVSRTLKYAIGFFSLIFLAIFVLEMIGKAAIHWIQYVLIGLAMVVFYVLLLALAEHVGFILSYGTSAFATTALVGWYVGDTAGSRRTGIIMAGVMALTYAIMFLLLREQDYALLAGAIIAFLSIASTMVVTRKVDWTGKKEPAATLTTG